MKLILLSTMIFVLGAQTDPAPSTAPSDAQKLQDVQAENQKLREELAAAQKRIKQLEAAAGQSAPAAQPPAPPATDATSDLMGNPIAVVDFFQKKFEEDMTKRRVPKPQEKDSKATRQVYLAKAKEWLDAMNRTTYSVEWRGRITDLGGVKGGSQDIEFQCVSPDNKTSYGRAVPVSVLKANAPQLGAALPDRDAIWIMSATLAPAMFLAPDMLQPNTFDNPPLAGPCVACKYQLKVTRLYPEKGAAPAAPKEN